MLPRLRGGCHGFYEQNQVLVLGQFISVLITFTGIFTQFLNQNFQVRRAWNGQRDWHDSVLSHAHLCGYL